MFTHNSASRNGGALCALGTNITLGDNINIAFNSARNGGAMYLESGASFTVSFPIELNISALEYGGAIYHQDTVTSVQCNFVNTSHFEQLPYCFLQFTYTLYKILQAHQYIEIIFKCNSTTNPLVEMDNRYMEDYWIDVG